MQDFASAKNFPPLINKVNSFGGVGVGSARFGQYKNISPSDKQGK